MRPYFLLLLILIISNHSRAQSIGIGTDYPDPNSILEIKSSTRGILIPRLTTIDRDTNLNSLGLAQEGLLIYNTTDQEFNYWNGTAWIAFPAGSSIVNNWDDLGAILTPSDGINENVSIGTTSSNGKLTVHSSASSVPTLYIESNDSSSNASALKIYLKNAENGGQGIYQETSGSLNGIQYGIFNKVSVIGTGYKFGIRNDLTDLNTDYAYATYNRVLGTAASEVMGTVNILNTNGAANQWGIKNNLQGSGTGIRYGIENVIDGATNVSRFGIYNKFMGSNESSSYGTYNFSDLTGGGDKYGSYNTFSISTTGKLYGNYTEILSNSTDTKYGNYYFSNNNTSGTQVANYVDINGASTNSKFGYYYASAAATNGQQRGAHVAINGLNASTSLKYGYFSTILGTVGGTHYGVASSVSGANRYGIYAENSNSSGYAGYFQGDVTVTGNFSNPSDRQFKKDIRPLSSALNSILALQPRSYYFKPELAKTWGFSKELQAGFIAQELEQVIPHLVMKESHTPRNLQNEIEDDEIDNPTEYKSVNYLGLLPYIIKAIQEQQEIIDKKDGQINSLESRIKYLEQQMNLINELLEK